MSLTSIESMKQNGCVMHWPGSYVGNGTYDDDGDKRGFLILPDGVSVTPNGTFTSVKGKDGLSYLKFDGSDSNYISVSNQSEFNLSNIDFTIYGWYKFTDLTNRHNIIANCSESGNLAYTGWHLFWHPSDGIGFYSYITGATITACAQSNIIGWEINKWYCIVLIKQGSTCDIYRDFTKIATGSGNLTAYPSSSPILLGMGPFLGLASAKYYNINGNIKDLMIFKGRALTLDQIAAIMDETFIY